MMKELREDPRSPAIPNYRNQVFEEQGAFQCKQDHGHALQQIEGGQSAGQRQSFTHGCSNGHLNINKNGHSVTALIDRG